MTAISLSIAALIATLVAPAAGADKAVASSTAEDAIDGEAIAFLSAWEAGKRTQR